STMDSTAREAIFLDSCAAAINIAGKDDKKEKKASKDDGRQKERQRPKSAHPKQEAARAAHQNVWEAGWPVSRLLLRWRGEPALRVEFEAPKGGLSMPPSDVPLPGHLGGPALADHVLGVCPALQRHALQVHRILLAVRSQEVQVVTAHDGLPWVPRLPRSGTGHRWAAPTERCRLPPGTKLLVRALALRPGGQRAPGLRAKRETPPPEARWECPAVARLTAPWLPRALPPLAISARGAKNGTRLTSWQLRAASWRLLIPSDLGSILKALDTDGSGNIDYTEFIAASITQKQYSQKAVLWAAFRRFDLDGNGLISEKEMAAMIQDDASFKVAKELIKEADVDGDGQVSFDEFCKIMGASA
ncbi:unnamed protein product, partial [Prorocentrum cordatum]